MRRKERKARGRVEGGGIVGGVGGKTSGSDSVSSNCNDRVSVILYTLAKAYAAQGETSTRGWETEDGE